MSERIYYNSDAQQPAENNQTRNMIMMIAAVGLVLGAIVSMVGIYRSRVSRPKTLREKMSQRIESGYDTSRDLTSGALKKLEEQYQSLRKEVDHLVSSVRN